MDRKKSSKMGRESLHQIHVLYSRWWLLVGGCRQRMQRDGFTTRALLKLQMSKNDVEIVKIGIDIVDI